jgi:hypothetical protein
LLCPIEAFHERSRDLKIRFREDHLSGLNSLPVGLFLALPELLVSTVSIALDGHRCTRPFAGNYHVEQLADQPERVYLIVILASRKAQEL